MTIVKNTVAQFKHSIFFTENLIYTMNYSEIKSLAQMSREEQLQLAVYLTQSIVLNPNRRCYTIDVLH